MSAANKHISRYGDARKILLIGDVSRAFCNVNAATNTHSKVCADMPEAIDIAARENFAAIAIVMAGISTRLSSGLKALRDNSDAKIISTLADDYFICPVAADKLYESIMTTGDRGKAETAPSAAIDTATETRIRQLERLATEDDLTGLKNRRYIWEFSRQIIEYAQKENARVTLLVFDVDNLKKYNDIYGHQAGDEILKQAAVLMQRCCRGHDVVGRIGGDEFAVLFWDDPQQKRAATPSKSDERRAS